MCAHLIHFHMEPEDILEMQMQTFMFKERESNHSPLLSLIFSQESNVQLTLNCNSSMVLIRITLLTALLEPIRKTNESSSGISKNACIFLKFEFANRSISKHMTKQPVRKSYPFTAFPFLKGLSAITKIIKSLQK